MPTSGDDISRLADSGFNLGFHFDFSNLPNPLSWISWSVFPDLGWWWWVVYAVIAFFLAITVGPYFGVLYGSPPVGYAGPLQRSFLPKIIKREKRDSLTGKVLTKTITTKDGKSREVPEMEWALETGGRPIGAILNLNDYYIDRHNYVTPNGKEYDPKTGKDVPITAEGKAIRKKREGHILHRFLANNFAIFYLGNYWFMNRIGKHAVRWWTRKEDELLRRIKWELYIRVTVVSTAIDMTDEKKPLEDIWGFPWIAKFTIRYRIRNVIKFLVEILDSPDQMEEIIQSAITQYWQEHTIIFYKGMAVDDKGNPVLSPPAASKTQDASIVSNKSLADELHAYIKQGRGDDGKTESLWLMMLNVLGAEIDQILVEEKTLTGDFAEQITRLRVAEITRQEMVEISKGMESQINVIRKGGAAGIAATMSGLFNPEGRPSPSSIENLTTAALFPQIANAAKGEKDKSRSKGAPKGKTNK